MAYEGQTNILRDAATEMPTPKTWQPVDDFAQEQVSTSVAEAAANSFKANLRNFWPFSPSPENIEDKVSLTASLVDALSSAAISGFMALESINFSVFLPAADVASSAAASSSSEIIDSLNS